MFMRQVLIKTNTNKKKFKSYNKTKKHSSHQAWDHIEITKFSIITKNKLVFLKILFDAIFNSFLIQYE